MFHFKLIVNECIQCIQNFTRYVSSIRQWCVKSEKATRTAHGRFPTDITVVKNVHILSVARRLALKQNVCSVENSVSGLLSAIVIFTIRQTPSLKSPKSECSCRSGGTPTLGELQILQTNTGSCLVSVQTIIQYWIFSPRTVVFKLYRLGSPRTKND